MVGRVPPGGQVRIDGKFTADFNLETDGSEVSPPGAS